MVSQRCPGCCRGRATTPTRSASCTCSPSWPTPRSAFRNRCRSGSQGLGEGWNGPYFGYDTVDFMIGESLLATEGGHHAEWLRTHHPEAVALYRPEAALDGPAAGLDEAWTSAVPDELHYNTWIADRALAFLARAEPPFMLFRLVARPAPSVQSPAPVGRPLRRGRDAGASRRAGRASADAGATSARISEPTGSTTMHRRSSRAA